MLFHDLYAYQTILFCIAYPLFMPGKPRSQRKEGFPKKSSIWAISAPHPVKHTMLR